jgi:hypothetical protein
MSARYRPMNAFPEQSWPDLQRRARYGVQLADNLIQENKGLSINKCYITEAVGAIV